MTPMEIDDTICKEKTLHQKSTNTKIKERECKTIYKVLTTKDCEAEEIQTTSNDKKKENRKKEVVRKKAADWKAKNQQYNKIKEKKSKRE